MLSQGEQSLPLDQYLVFLHLLNNNLLFDRLTCKIGFSFLM